MEKITALRHQSVIINNHSDADSTSTHPAPPASSRQRFSQLTLRASRCWIRLVSGPTMSSLCSQGVSIRKKLAASDLTRDRVHSVSLTGISNLRYHAAFLGTMQHYLTGHRIPSFSHCLQWMWQQKIATKAESASDINHRDGEPLTRAIWLKVKEQKATLTRQWVK